MASGKIVNCVSCGVKHHRCASWLSRANNYFCSAICRTEYYGQSNTNCKNCNKQIRRSSTRLFRNAHNFCSKVCFYKYGKRQIDNERLKQLYLQGIPSTQIARLLSCNTDLIYRRLRTLGVSLKNHRGLGVKKQKEKEIVACKNCSTPFQKLKHKSTIFCSKFCRAGFRKGSKHTEEVKQKIREARHKQILPIKDTVIEIKIQDFLKQLGAQFFTHQYIKDIEHGYQCDILIPSMNLVIECDGDYWHKYPIGRDIDHIRTSELIQKGFKVLRLWEREIKVMNLAQFKEKLQSSEMTGVNNGKGLGNMGI